MVTRQLQVEHRTAKELWTKTDVLPLSHAGQVPNYVSFIKFNAKHTQIHEQITKKHQITIDSKTNNMNDKFKTRMITKLKYLTITSLGIYRVAQNKPDYSNSQPSLRKFA